MGEARTLLAQYGAASSRERNYRSAMYANLLADALAEVVASCTPLRAEVAAQFEDIYRRAMYGPDAAKAMAPPRPRHLRPVE
jgi:hypothetical protein